MTPNCETTSDCAAFWNVHVPEILARAGSDTGLGAIDGVAHFSITGPGGGDWAITAWRGEIVSIRPGAPPRSTFRVVLPVSTFLDIARGARDHREAFFQGDVEIAGDIELALWVANLIPILRERFPFEPALSRSRAQ